MYFFCTIRRINKYNIKIQEELEKYCDADDSYWLIGINLFK